MSRFVGNHIHNPGDVIGARYEVLSYIGAGGMQEVYKARDNLLQRTVALKAPKNGSAEKRFKRSAIVSARVNHANVAKTLDYIDDGQTAYLVEEYVDGKDLSRVLKEHFPSLDPMRAAFVFHRLAKGLAASHHAGVIHRDLKPSNVMSVGGQLIDDIKITDFGIAKMAEAELGEAVEGGDESITASATALGAMPYMAPEMFEGMKNAGQPADVWSTGCMMYELLTGKKPFGVGLKAVRAIGKEELPPISVKFKVQFRSLASEVEEVIKECLQIDPSKRLKADEIVSRCEGLCYPLVTRETGTVSRFDNQFWGFISADDGSSVFFHRDSIFGADTASVGDRVVFSRFKGGGADRAFPVLRHSPRPGK